MFQFWFDLTPDKQQTLIYLLLAGFAAFSTQFLITKSKWKIFKFISECDTGKRKAIAAIIVSAITSVVTAISTKNFTNIISDFLAIYISAQSIYGFSKIVIPESKETCPPVDSCPPDKP